MIDIEDRLRRDAQAWRRDDHAPSFDDALDLVTARTRRRRGGWLAVAATVAIIAAVVTSVLVWPSGDHAPAGGSDRTVRTLVRNMVPTVAVRGDSPKTVTVWVPCPATGLTAVVHESATSVFVRVDGYLRLTGSDTSTAYQCDTQPKGLTLELNSALGSRTVTCKCAGGTVPVLDRNELPEPKYLPAGLNAQPPERIDPASNRLTGERSYVKGYDRISVAVGVADQLPGAGQKVVGHIDIEGHRAAITKPSGTCLTWSIRPSVDIAVCVVGRDLPSGVAAAVARSLY